ncbi:MAG TPA: hypothetical protein VJS13_16095 [Pyrinomonadaceae bacterium]|nr:hypothetical protein [Pyrinomonadaceae bacterium]
MSPLELWRFLPLGYLLTIAIETPILFFALSPHHPKRHRVMAGLWLTACTYPIVMLVLPLLMVNYSRSVYLLVAETFAPVAECILFWLAFGSGTEFGRRSMWRDFGAIVLANLASFSAGEIIYRLV